MPDSPLITISIASYNTQELLRKCLLALQARQAEGEANLQIIVADNASVDGSPEMVRSEFTDVLLVETGGNLGYGRANNRAFEHARGKYFCPLNSDAEVEPGALATMRDFLEEHQDVGAVGPRLVYPDGSPQNSYGDDPHLWAIFQEQTFLGKILPRLLPRAPIPELQEPTDKDQVVGACQFMRADVYREIGGYDSNIFMYHEDVDLNIRIRRAGWRVVYLPHAVVVHHLGASSEFRWRRRARTVSALNWSRYYAFHRDEGHSVSRKLKAFFILGASIRLTIWTILSLFKPSALDRVRLFRVVLRNAVAMQPDQERKDSMSGIG